MKLSIDITREDYADFNKFHFKQTRLKRTIMIGVLAIIITQMIVNGEGFDLTATIISTIVGIGLYSFLIYRSLTKTKNIPDSNGSILGEKEIEFAEDKIFYKTSNSEGSSDWSVVKELKESKGAFYLYMDANMAMLVPKRSFKDDNETGRFRSLVAGKLKMHKSV
jgi:hypothetical protein